MASWKPLLAAAGTAMAFFVSSAAGATSDSKPHIYPLTTVPQWESSSSLVLSISPSTIYRGANQFVVFPLTSVNGANQSAPVSVGVQGNLVEATLKNFATIEGSDQIALLACDPLNTTFIDPDGMLSVLMDNNPAAILLYSETGDFCDMENPRSDYQSIFTMASKNDTTLVLNVTESAASVAAAINSSDTLNGGSDDSGTTGTGTGGNSTVAMSILYSITGLITVLFLIIIATGAMRAHRYPERYGPRGASGGRPRQSRAKGIARAMLETLPIVKFGDTTTAKPDPGLELENGVNSSHQTPAGSSDSDAAAPAQVVAHLPSTMPAGGAETQVKTEGADTRAVGATGSASGKEAEHQSVEETPSCSICTEDFTVGEDVRVLPCNHKFHPNCVDPWLVNVSGTCPLCRLDLRPSPTEGDEQPVDDADMPPPLDADEAGMTPAVGSSSTNANASHRRGPARFLDLNRLRHASVEERLEALRRYRAEHHMMNRRATGSMAASLAAAAAAAPMPAVSAVPATAETAAEGDDDHGRSARLTRRLRDKFRIKTHAQTSGPGSA